MGYALRKGVSVIVPVYNGQKYLEEFLNSLFQQIYRPIEVIIGDDASRDKSVDICQKWKDSISDDDFTVVITENKVNRGLTKNIAGLIKLSTCEYIAFADQDDVWKADKLRIQVDYMEEHTKCNVCLCDRSLTDENLKIKIQSEQQSKNYKKRSLLFDEVVLHSGCYAANTMLIRAGISGILDIPQDVICYDYYMAIMASVTGTVDYINRQLVLYRIHGNNLSCNYKAETSNSFLQLFIRRYKSHVIGRDSDNRDGEIISRELKERYGIDINDFKNVVNKDRAMKNVIITTFFECVDDLKNGRIGLWYK